MKMLNCAKSWAILSFILLFHSLLNARINFIHIPKTGGMTLTYLLENLFSEDEILPYRGIKAYYKHTHVSSYDEIPYFSHQLIRGHYHYSFFEDRDPSFDDSFTFTILRNPVDQVISLFNYSNKGKIQYMSPIEIKPNIMCRFLSSDRSLDGEELLENAKANVNKLKYILFFENYEAEIKGLFRHLGIDPSWMDIPKINTIHKTKTGFDDETIEKIKERNALDIELYRYAKNIAPKINSVYYQDFPAFNNLRVLTDRVDYNFSMPLKGNGWKRRIVRAGQKPQCLRKIANRRASIFFPLKRKDYEIFVSMKVPKKTSPILFANREYVELKKIKKASHSLYAGIVPQTSISKHSETEFILSCWNYSHEAIEVSRIMLKPLK